MVLWRMLTVGSSTTLTSSWWTTSPQFLTVRTVFLNTREIIWSKAAGLNGFPAELFIAASAISVDLLPPFVHTHQRTCRKLDRKRTSQFPHRILLHRLHQQRADNFETVRGVLIFASPALNRFRFLKYLDYEDDICLFSYWLMILGQVALDLERQASKVGLKINTNKTKVFTLTDHRTFPIYFHGQNIEGI